MGRGEGFACEDEADEVETRRRAATNGAAAAAEGRRKVGGADRERARRNEDSFGNGFAGRTRRYGCEVRVGGERRVVGWWEEVRRGRAAG